MTGFTDQEKEIIKSLVKKQLENVEKTEKLPNQDLGDFNAETVYADILKNILKKL